MQDTSYGILGGLGGIGALIGFGQLLLSDEKVTLRRATGRAIVTGGLSMSAAAVLTWFPALPTVALVGLAAVFATLGTAGLERMIQRYMPGGAANQGDRLQ